MSLRAMRAQLPLLLTSGVLVALMVLWATHDGGYDADTWYWGALLVLALLTATIVLGRARRLSRLARLALLALGGYVAFSYLSIAWAQTPGWALEGSNRALLYALVFALLLVLPWRAEAALLTLTAYALGIGVIAVVMLLRLASHDHLAGLVIDGRLAAPTGYFNSSVALFMIDALLATALATRRELPGIVRGLLIAIACASLQLCVMGQSRGWLFTLPFVLVIAAAVVRERLRMAAAATLPVAAALIPVHRLLGVFQGHTGAALDRAAQSAGRIALLICAAALVLGTLLAWAETLRPPRTLSRAARLRVGTLVASLAIVLGAAGILAATHGHPVTYVKRQWRGFIHPPASTSSSSHFTAVGTNRYDFWRVALDAVVTHPVGGLGQDNFADYYVARRRSYEETRWTHSLELRLLAQTGLVGALLFAAFLVAALMAAARAVRRAPPPAAAVAAAALLPLVVWLVHGSIDWFWEVPALSAPALGFLAIAAALGGEDAADQRLVGWQRWQIPPWLPAAAGLVALPVAVLVLGLPYLAVRETSRGSDNSQRNPVAALDQLRTAADLNPLSPDPTRLAGLIALQTDRLDVAQQRFAQTTSREPGGWLGWLGAGLVASALGDSDTAARDFQVAARIDPREYTISLALDRVHSLHPMTPAQALARLASE